MVLGLFSGSGKDDAGPQESESSRALRESGARVQTNEHGEAYDVSFDVEVSAGQLELLLACPAVERLTFDWCYDIGDEEIRRLAQLQTLQHLVLRGAECTGAGLEAFAGHPELSILDLDGSSVTDESLSHVTKIPKLNSLFLRFTSIGDAGVANLEGIPELNVLHLDGSLVTGAALPSVRTHRKLQVVSLPSGIDGDDLQQLSGFGSLRWLWVGDANVDSESVERLKETLNPMCSVSWRRKGQSA